MGFKLKTYFDSDNEVFIKYYYGQIQIEDIFNSWNELIKKKKIPKQVKKFIINYKNASINFKPERVKDIASFYKKHNNIFANTKIAMIMESPDQVVFPHLIVFEEISFQINTFYTMDAAINWLNS